MKKFPVALNIFNNNSTKKYYRNIEKKCHNFKLCNANLETVENLLDFSLPGRIKSSWFGRNIIKILKDGAEALALTLCNLLNLSIKQSLFLDQCKIAKLKLLFKKYSDSDLKNNRCMSLVPAVSKVIQNTIQIETQECLNKKWVALWKYQSALPSNFSFNFCLIKLMSFILRQMDKGYHTDMILIDLQKTLGPSD